MSSNIEIQRICQYCNKEFTARTTVTKYCSHKCSSRAYKARTRKKKIEKSNTETKQKVVQPIETLKVKEFLNIVEVSQLVGISKRSVYRMIERGDLNKIKIGSRTIIRRSELNQLLELPKPEQPQPEPVQYSIDDCYTIGEVLDKYSISQSGLRNLLIKHKVPKIKKWKYVYVPKPIIDNLLT